MTSVEEKLPKIFKRQEGITAVYLFGSQAKGKTDKFSDFDLAVLFKSGDDEKWAGWDNLHRQAFRNSGRDHTPQSPSRL